MTDRQTINSGSNSASNARSSARQGRYAAPGAGEGTGGRVGRRPKAQRRRQMWQSLAALGLIGVLVAGEVARMHSSIPAPESAKLARLHKEPAPAPPPVQLTPEELTRLHVNEGGLIPILEYHEIGTPPAHAGRATRRMYRETDAFQRDLARLYAENYRPISLRDYVANHIDVPAGMTPVVLTFDDARASQFRYLPDGSIDPDCAVGIMQEFSRTHTDFPLKATFFVLTNLGFGAKEVKQKKLQALLAMGCDLQNHTLNHRYFAHMGDEAIIREIARGKSSIEQMAPGAHVDMLALPGGQHPRSHNNAILLRGSADGVAYDNIAVFDAWGGPAPAPASVKYDRLRIPRIEPIEDEDGLTYWLNYLKSHPQRRYISDGDPSTVSVPQSKAALIDRKRLQNVTLRVYSLPVPTENRH